MDTGLMEGKICLVTGGSSGIGFAAAGELARLGATVVIVDCASTETNAVARIVEETGNRRVRHLTADLSSQAEVRRLAGQFREWMPRLDVLVNNVGAVFLFKRRSVDGIEMTFALNHLGHFLLTTLLLDLLQDSTPARVVNVSSSYHRSVDKLSPKDLPSADRSGRHPGIRALQALQPAVHLRTGETT